MNSRLKRIPLSAAACICLSSTAVRATEPDSAEAHAVAQPAHPVEIGLFGGLFFPPEDHTLFESGRTRRNYEEVAAEFGARAGGYPIPYLGAELELSHVPSATRRGNAAKLFIVRGHGVVRIPTPSITPFLLAGGGGIFTSGALGSESDPAFHFGGGAKLPMGELVSLRLEARDTIIWNSDDEARHHPEILFGLSLGFGGERPPPPPPPPPADTDADGVLDATDACPEEAGAPPSGCPVRDADADGIDDDVDRCPAVVGIAPDGCPDPDADEDGVSGAADRCPEVAGIAPDGCPDPDADKDGVAGEADRCPDNPETANGFEDTDGCPDELPEKIRQFTGVIRGIEFDFGKATLRKTSLPTLDAAIAVLKEYPALRIRITGHTDDVGTREVNLERSAQRAAAVKDYMVKQGVDAARIETAGAGPDSPVADNETEANRQKNRRIEFAILQ